jgi:hypothetical protein
MPSLVLTDLASMRLEAISFFLLLLALSALAVQRLWNYLRGDWPRLPHLAYPKALGMVGLWGLLFMIVLAMISGARELMTPGAWDKVGVTYKVRKESAAPAPAPADESARRNKLAQLQTVLWMFAAEHGRALPSADESSIAPEAWQTLDSSGVRYLYYGGRIDDKEDRVIALEPRLFGETQFALFASGRIEVLHADQLQQRLARQSSAPGDQSSKK